MNKGTRLISKPVVHEGLLFGVILGIIMMLYTILTNLSIVNANEVLTVIFWIATFGLSTLAGLRTAQVTGIVISGIWAGLITCFTAILLKNFATAIISVVFFDFLRQHALQDRDFLRSGIADYGNYLIDDTIGGFIFGTIAFSVLGLLLGAFGGLIGKQRSQLR